MEKKYIILAILLTIIGFLALIFIVRGLIGLAHRTTGVKDAVQEVQLRAVPADEIVANPVVYKDQKVTVDSKVYDWVTNRSFTMSNSNARFGQVSQLIVISNNSFPLPENAGEMQLALGDKVNVRAKGTVRIMTTDQLEKELGYRLDSPELLLDNNNFSEWKLGPVLILDSVEKI
ncbi:MAG: hypothetical protein E6Q89_00530 [Bacteroidia bacterium]|nr:MAG: hypothetical protein E6Q89_00530 [Bacteroidia bacterium]